MTAAGERIERGEFARLVYRLGRNEATGILTLTDDRERSEVLVLRRGALCADDARAGLVRLARLAVLGPGVARFDGGVAAHPPVPASRTVPLAAWARRHLESQVDATRAEALTAQLAGARLSIRPELAPPPAMLDEADRRILAAMAQPRRLDQIWPLARTPRFRLLAFLHFMRQVGGLVEAGIGAFDSGPHRARSIRARPRPRGCSASTTAPIARRSSGRIAGWRGRCTPTCSRSWWPSAGASSRAGWPRSPRRPRRC
jgi:hypothetical protein